MFFFFFLLASVSVEGVSEIVQYFFVYSQLSPGGNPARADTPIIRTAAKSEAKRNYRHWTEISSRYYGPSVIRTLTRGPYSVRYNES